MVDDLSMKLEKVEKNDENESQTTPDKINDILNKLKEEETK